ncbi:hypothetical protein [Salipaludibacillus daqingensis]|uniref:hypothetical protein n=1 Tax=Salipaludibacillus daqingensis TaxID=3041001 RepID=UPI0024740A05|nr:hypothetical protein [Salipaludibacillus daqingensis]
MKKSFNEPKGFGEILDHTFHLSKSRFKDFAKIFLILLGPIILLEALVQFAYGMSFFRETAAGDNWFERIMNSFDEGEGAVAAEMAGGLWLSLLAIISLFIYPIAYASVLIVVNHLKKGEEYTVGSVIKQAFSRFWPILGSNILFFLIIIGMFIVPIIVIASGTFMADGFVSIFFMILFIILGFLLFFGLIATRLSFYFGSVVIDKVSPGFGRSWRLSQNRTWALFGLYIVLSLIIGVISFAMEATFAAFLGNSVLMSLINSLVLLFTTILFTVGYAVMFFDLKTRHDGDDVKDMLDDYNKEQ